MRLTDVLMTEAEPQATPRAAANGLPLVRIAPVAATAAAPLNGPSLVPLDAAPDLADTWVTVFGFAPSDLPAVLREFQRCGDILQWGTFGSGGGAGGAPPNFVHVQFASRYSAQRALLKSGEQLSPSLIIGVKTLDPRHQQAVEAYSAGGGGNGSAGTVPGLSPALRIRPALGGGAVAAAAARPYRVDAAAATMLPQPSRTLMQKLSEFVLGV